MSTEGEGGRGGGGGLKNFKSSPPSYGKIFRAILAKILGKISKIDGKLQKILGK
jgi:hypothetical protein